MDKVPFPPATAGAPGIGRTDAGVSRSRTSEWLSYIQAQTVNYVTPVELELPSGIHILAIRPPLLVMMQNGMIPDALTPLVDEMIKAAMEGGEQGAAEKLTQGIEENPLETVNKFVSLMDHVWINAVIDPVFVLDESNIPFSARARLEKLPLAERVAIPMRRVDMNDKMFFFAWAQGVDQDLKSFREQPPIPVEVAPQVQGLGSHPGGAPGA